MKLSPSAQATALRTLSDVIHAGCPAQSYYVSSNGVTLLVSPIERERWAARFPDDTIAGVPLHLQTVQPVMSA